MDEWTARKFIFLSYIIIFIVIFGLIVYIVILKDKINENKCPECEVCNNTENNNSNNNNTNNENNNPDESSNNNSDTTSLTLGKDLWKKAYDFYWDFSNNAKITNVSVGINQVDNYNSFDYSIFTSGAKEEFNKYYEIENKNGEYYISQIRKIKDSTYLKTESFIISEEDTTRIEFKVTSEYCTTKDNSNCSDIAKVENEFVIFKDNNTWKIYSFVLPD